MRNLHLLLKSQLQKRRRKMMPTWKLQHLLSSQLKKKLLLKSQHLRYLRKSNQARNKILPLLLLK